MSIRGYDAWKLREEPMEDAPLHTHCAECNVRLANYFEEVEGRCEECETHDAQLRELWLEDIDEEAA